MKNDFAQVKAQASCKSIADKLLERKGKQWICPKCGSGTHKNGTPAFNVTPDGKHWSCFVCNPEGGDCFELVGMALGIEDKRAQLEKVAELEGIELGSAKTLSLSVANDTAAADTLPNNSDELAKFMDRDSVSIAELKALMVERGKTQQTQPVSTWEPNFIKWICEQWGDIVPLVQEKRAPTAEQAAAFVSAHLAAARDNLKNAPGGADCAQYFKDRGYTEDEIARFGFGYNPKFNNAVIPWAGAAYYAERRLVVEPGENKYFNADTTKAGSKPLFNPAAFEQDSVILVEGLLDAWALIAAGFDNVVSLATNNVSNKELQALTDTNYKGVIILALDNDNAGANGMERAKQKLDEAGILYIEGTAAPEGYKDAGELFQTDRKELVAHYSKLQEQAEQKREELLDKALTDAGLASPADVAEDIYLLANIAEPVPTGFAGVDRVLGGGLKMGLTILGAASSMGKTSFVHQSADNIAASGKPVLFVTIEQTKKELVTKSLSRLAREVAGNLDNGKPNTNGVLPADAILDKGARKRWNKNKNAILLQACETLTSTISPYMRIWHPAHRPSVSDIKQHAELMQRRYDEPPVIFIDYLQLLKQEDERDNEKRAVDKNVTALRDLAGELETPIFALSSISREAYYMPIDTSSFKESGGIEYGADVLLGLQVRNFEKRLVGHDKKGKTYPLTGEIRKTVAKEIFNEVTTSSERELELVVLKNRNGAKSKKPIPLDFLPVSMLFTEPNVSKWIEAANAAPTTPGTSLSGELDEEE